MVESNNGQERDPLDCVPLLPLYRCGVFLMSFQNIGEILCSRVSHKNDFFCAGHDALNLRLVVAEGAGGLCLFRCSIGYFSKSVIVV